MKHDPLRQILIDGLNSVYDLANEAQMNGHTVQALRRSYATSTIVNEDGKREQSYVLLHSFAVDGVPA